MNRWIGRVVTMVSVASAFAVVPVGAAFAQPSAMDADEALDAAPGHGQGLFGQALQLDSLTADQRASIEGVLQSERAATTPVRQARARVLTTLALQVEAGAVDPGLLAPQVRAQQGAAMAALPATRDAIQKIHDILTPAQRSQLVDAIESHAPRRAHDGGAAPTPLEHLGAKLGLTAAQKQQIASNLDAARQAHATGSDPAVPGGGRWRARRAWLESFRSDSFSASSLSGDSAQAAMDRRANRVEEVIQAAIPVLTPAQRAEVATHLRARAAHDGRS
jgi:Spy/CpxP family protein refolding chaperone